MAAEPARTSESIDWLASVVTLMETETVNRNVLIYLNRLSDYLFVLGRVANANGTADVLWVPGKSR